MSSDPNINTETGETVASRSPRFSLWAAFLVFATITLGSAKQVKDNSIPVTASNKYAVACAAVTFVMTVIAVAFHFFPVTTIMFVQTKVEGIFILVLTAFWAAIVAVDTDAASNLASPQDSANTVQNANLYYFSWAGFITAVILLVSFTKAAFGVDVVGEVQSRAARLQWWAALLAAAVVVLGSASRAKSRDCQGDTIGEFSPQYCRKTKFAIASGVITTAFVLLVIFSKVFQYSSTSGPTPFLMELGSAILLTILNAFAVAYTTSADSPGSAIGNLYYFSWAAFLLPAVIGAECYSEYSNPPKPEETYPNNNNNAPRPNYNNNGDIEVETFDDNI